MGNSISFLNPDISEKVAANIGVSYSYYHFKDDFETNKMGYLRVPIYANFRLSKSNFIPFFNIGLTPTMSNSGANIFIHTGLGCTINHQFNFSTYLESENLNFSGAMLLFFSVGVNLNSRK